MRQRQLSLRERIVFRGLRPLPATAFEVLTYRWIFGRWSLFRDPQTFSERLRAYKLGARDPMLTRTADKLAVREYVSERIGEGYLIPLVGSVSNPRELQRLELPDAFVIKASHGNNATLLVPDRSELDMDAAERITSQWLEDNWYRYNKEWAYRDIPPRLVVEKFIGSDGHPPPDYKFFCFHGEPRLVQVDTARFEDHRRDLFDVTWRAIEVEYTYPPADETPAPPGNLAEMLTVARELASGFEFVRVDLYCWSDGVLFGELTHYPDGGMKRFSSDAFDRALGAVWANGPAIPEVFFAR